MKFLKKLIISLCALLLLVTIVLWALAKSVSPTVIKDYVSTQLTTLTDQKSRVNGDISWQIFPRPGIKITGVQIGDQANQNSYSVQLDNLLFNLKITPLLRGKLVFSELNVDGFQININPNAAPTKVKKVASTSTKKPHNIAEQFAIERFLLSRGKIVVNEYSQVITLSNLQIGAEQFNLKKIAFPVQFKTQFDVASAGKSVVKAQVNFKGSTALSASLLNAPMTLLQNMPLEGQLAVQDLKTQQLKISKIRANVKTKTGVLLLNPLTLNMYNGESVGDLSYEFASMKLILNQTATNLDGNKLIYDLVKKKLFKGSVDFSIHTQANMQTGNLAKNIEGQGSLSIKNGIVESINLDKVIDETSSKINALLTGKKDKVQNVLQLSQFDNPDYFKGSTKFKLLTFQYTLANEKLLSNSLILQTDRLQLNGEGQLNLKDNEIDSHLFAKVSLNDPEVDKIQQLLGGNFPLLAKGNLTEPSVLPDLKIINPILTRFWLKETLAKPVKHIHKQIKTLLTNKND